MKSSFGRYFGLFCESLTGFGQGSFIVLPEATSASLTLLEFVWRISLSLRLTITTSDVLRSYNSGCWLVAHHISVA